MGAANYFFKRPAPDWLCAISWSIEIQHSQKVSGFADLCEKRVQDKETEAGLTWILPYGISVIYAVSPEKRTFVMMSRDFANPAHRRRFSLIVRKKKYATNVSRACHCFLKLFSIG